MRGTQRANSIFVDFKVTVEVGMQHKSSNQACTPANKNINALRTFCPPGPLDLSEFSSFTFSSADPGEDALLLFSDHRLRRPLAVRPVENSASMAYQFPIPSADVAHERSTRVSSACAG